MSDENEISKSGKRRPDEAGDQNIFRKGKGGSGSKG
jgi:hypothetical protein